MASTDTRTQQEIHKDNLLEIERHLQESLDFINSISDPTFGHVRLRIGKHIMQDMQWLAAQTGNFTVLSAIGTAGGSVSFTPTDLLNSNAPKMIMGKVVGNDRQPIAKADLAPKKSEQDKFNSQVRDLYNGFLGLKDKDLIAMLAKPGGEALIRGVAKMAGVEHFATIDASEIDTSFFADIRSGIKDTAAANKLTDNLEAKIAKTDAVAAEVVKAPAKKAVVAKKGAEPKAAAPKKSAAKKGASLDDYE